MPSLLGRVVKEATDVLRIARFFDAQADPWVRLPVEISCHAFGQASEREFASYLQGPSRVKVQSIDDLCAWLRGCEAIDDQTLFFQPDFWQHPVTFEQVRKGDCEDHALWAWRQLVHLGYSALFIAGLWRAIPHTWVQFESGGHEFIVETTAKNGDIVLPLPNARDYYCPALAVDSACRTFVYQGYTRFRSAVAPPASPTPPPSAPPA